MNTTYKLYLTTTLLILSLSIVFPNQAQETYLKVLDDDSYQDKSLKLEDWVYQTHIRTVQLYAYSSISNGKDKSAAPIIPITNQRAQPWILEFDILGDDSDYYEAKIIHCNSDWSVSNEVSINYL
jgi:hypothetical protein